MDKALVELIETEGGVFGPDALVWMPATDNARAEYEDTYFLSQDCWDLFPGCTYLGTVRDIQASIAATQAMITAPNKDIAHAE